MIAESLLKQIDYGRLGKNQGISIGLPKLESVIDGLLQATYTLLFAGTGSGKSTLALYSYVYKPLMDHLDDDKLEVVYFSLEMSANFIMAKLLCMYIFDTYGIQLSTKELLSKKKNYILNDELYKIVLECQPWVEKVEKVLTIYDKQLNASVLYSILMKKLSSLGAFSETEFRKIYTPNNPDKIVEVVIDHLALVHPSDGRKLKEEMDLISAYLVALRDKCNISPLVIMQANRDSTSMDRRKQGLINFRLSDTKDSGNPPQDCNVALSILNPNREKLLEYRGYDIKTLEDNFRSITVLKDREGASDVEVGCNFFGRIGVWHELPRPDEITNLVQYTDPMYILNKEDNTKMNLKIMD